MAALFVTARERKQLTRPLLGDPTVKGTTDPGNELCPFAENHDE